MDTTWMVDCSWAGEPSGYILLPSLYRMVKWVSNQPSGSVIINGNGGCSFLAAYRRANGSSPSTWSKGRQSGVGYSRKIAAVFSAGVFYHTQPCLLWKFLVQETRINFWCKFLAQVLQDSSACVNPILVCLTAITSYGKYVTALSVNKFRHSSLVCYNVLI